MKISAYTTCRNVITMNYPFEAAIRSFADFCDEVVVLDSSDEKDGTEEALGALKIELGNKLQVHKREIDWKAPNHGVFDGETKAMSRSLCSKESKYLIQFDSDEVCHEDHSSLYLQTIQELENGKSQSPDKYSAALPVIEFWGSEGKVRMDTNYWKWRITPNHPDITHGIPGFLRKYEDGLLYAQHNTDGCDYIDKNTLEPLPCMGYVPEQMEKLRQIGIYDWRYVDTVEQFVNQSIEQLPGVFHYSWFNIERKINQYKQFWTIFWKALYNEERDERNNPFFPGLMWSEVSDEMIKDKAKQLETETCGHIFHQPYVSGVSKKTNGIKINKSHPKYIQEWIKQNKCL